MWCQSIPQNQSVLLISTEIPSMLIKRVISYISIKGYPYLMTSNYYSHNFLENTVYMVLKNVTRIT